MGTTLRRSRRLAILLAVTAVAVAATLTTGAGPAFAVTVCTVNGTPVTTVSGVIDGTSGDDTIVCPAVTGFATVRALAGNDSVTVAAVSLGAVDLGDGNDTLDAGALAALATIFGGGGNDTIQFAADADVLGVVDGDIGDDIITATENNGTIIGWHGADTITVTVNASILPDTGRILGQDGDDTITVTVNTGTVDGGSGSDTCNVPPPPPGTVTNC